MFRNITSYRKLEYFLGGSYAKPSVTRKLRTNYNSFGSIIPGREYTSQSIAGYRFGFNTQEKDDEIYGKGNASSAQFWEYDTRLGRRWNLDPKPQIKISDYSCFGNNPIFLIDIKGDKFVNPYKTQLETKEEKKSTAQKRVDNYKGNTESRKYRKLEKALRNATDDYNITQHKMNLVENTIKDLAKYNNDLYNRIENLKDPFDNPIDVYIHLESNLTTRPFSKMGTPGFDNPKSLAGVTIAEHDPKNMGTKTYFKDGTIIKIAGLLDNRIDITLDIDSDLGLTLSHESGHAFYEAKNMGEYLEWISKNPDKAALGGHGPGDPSGLAADKEEKIYESNRKKDKK